MLAKPQSLPDKLNPMSEPIARAATPPNMAIDFRTGDVFTAELGRRFDFVISSQMTHHLSDEALVAFIRWMERIAGGLPPGSPLAFQFGRKAR